MVTSAPAQTRAPMADAALAPVVVVGAGPAGLQCVRELVRLRPQQGVVLYGDEPWQPYNRVRLTGLLTGECKISDLETSLDFLQQGQVEQRYGCRIASLDVANKQVIDSYGQYQHYSQLILATGSSAHIPNLPGVKLAGVYNLRDLNDAQALMARQVKSRRVVVLGGGLLGLEAAKAMQRFNAEVFVVDHMPRLMSRQLDSGGAELLREQVLKLGLHVLLSDPVLAIEGEGAVERIVFRSGRKLACDTVILATGIRPNIGLARDAGIAFGRGIKVNDRMQTGQPGVYAVGECAEHNGTVYGIVAPGLEQAAVAVHNLLGMKARYAPSVSATQLRVAGCKVFSVGHFGEGISPLDRNSYVYLHPEFGTYRRLEIRHGRIVGAVAVGEWGELNRLQEAVISQRRIWPWQRSRFKRSGELWRDRVAEQVAEWPANAILCQCIGVTHSAVKAAIGKQGCQTLQALRECTGAASVCGACKPLLSQLLPAETATAPEPAKAPLRGVSILTLLTTLTVSLGGALANRFMHGILKHLSL